MAGFEVIQRVRALLWAISPLLIGLLFVMIYAAPLRIGSVTIPMPLLPFMAIYFWSMTNPSVMPPPAIFMIGLFQDFLTGGPVGLWALTYLLSIAVLSTQREVFVGKGRSALWAGFALSILIASLIVWLTAWVSLGAVPRAGKLGVEMVVTLIAFVPVSRLFAMVHRATSQSRRMVVNSTMAQS